MEILSDKKYYNWTVLLDWLFTKLDGTIYFLTDRCRRSLLTVQWFSRPNVRNYRLFPVAPAFYRM